MTQMIYLLKLNNGSTQRWDCQAFGDWCKDNGLRIGQNMQTRLVQLRQYTGLNVIDWTTDELRDYEIQ